MKATVLLVPMILLSLVAPAPGQERSFETCWSLDDEGNPLVWPHPANSPAQHEMGKA